MYNNPLHIPLSLNITSDASTQSLVPGQASLSLPTSYTPLEEPPTFPSLNTVLNHRSVLVSIKSPGAGHLTRHRAIKRIEAMTFDLSPDPERGDAERAGAKGPEKTAEGGGDEGTCTSKRYVFDNEVWEKELDGAPLRYRFESLLYRDLFDKGKMRSLPNALQSSAYNPPSRSRRRPASLVSPS